MTDGTSVYRAFLDALDRQDLDGAAAHVDTARYREDCALSPTSSAPQRRRQYPVA